ncbi:hypothetical protein [Oscillatoria sp. HE19RPO]|uniref:hypothetical protein n=1 Tax=Oscillatoria sp. HE19RPO TaxID=2954806 RepID=UPI0020C3C897|nr:hypothetical protein [Oscillatoria sp. HE19RPO]
MEIPNTVTLFWLKLHKPLSPCQTHLGGNLWQFNRPVHFGRGEQEDAIAPGEYQIQPSD